MGDGSFCRETSLFTLESSVKGNATVLVPPQRQSLSLETLKPPFYELLPQTSLSSSLRISFLSIRLARNSSSADPQITRARRCVHCHSARQTVNGRSTRFTQYHSYSTMDSSNCLSRVKVWGRVDYSITFQIPEHGCIHSHRISTRISTDSSSLVDHPDW